MENMEEKKFDSDSDIQTCVMNNGWVSENFKNTRVNVKDILYQRLFYLSKSWT
jgi:hypothetical protein